MPDMPDEDLYAILGVLPNAEDVVITAAFRALAQRYHPDKWTGPPNEAHSRMSRINAAYSILGNTARRAEYDKGRAAASHSNFNTEEEDQSTAFANAMLELEERWKLASSVFPDLVSLRSRLARISTSLAFAFVTVLLDSKSFTHREAVASQLEGAFLRQYFGTNETVLAYALSLILEGEREAAKYLNKLVDVLGSEVEAKLLINRVEDRFGIRARKEQQGRSAKQVEDLRNLKKGVKAYGYYSDAKLLANTLGFKTSEKGGGIFSSAAIEVLTPNGEKLEMKNSTSFISWVQQTLCDAE